MTHVTNEKDFGPKGVETGPISLTEHFTHIAECLIGYSAILKVKTLVLITGMY